MRYTSDYLLVCVHTISIITHGVYAVLPPHVGALTHLDRDALIVHYFHLGFDYGEILGFLVLCHGIQEFLVLMAYIGGSPIAAQLKSYEH